jgi:RimJ/RimL family protein N-acetyltransferase
MESVDLRDFEERFSRYLTHRVAIRPMSMSDMWPIWHATRNPDFNRFLLWNRPDDVRQVEDRLERIGDERRLGQMAAVSGVVRATGEWVCALRLYRIDPPEGVAAPAIEGGIWVHPNFWKSGLAVELARLTVDAVFAESNATVFRACAASGNRPSHAMLQASGFIPRRESIVDKEDGTPSPTMEFEILRPEWKPWFDQGREYDSPEYVERIESRLEIET